MKKPLKLLSAGVLASFLCTSFVACYDVDRARPYCEPVYFTTDYKIVNRIDSSIVVEIRSEDGQVTTIHPGEERVIYIEDSCFDPNPLNPNIAYLQMFPLEKLEIEMRIDGEIVHELIWWGDHWKSSRIGHFEPDGSRYFLPGEHYRPTYTLNVTYDVLEYYKDYDNVHY